MRLLFHQISVTLQYHLSIGEGSLKPLKVTVNGYIKIVDNDSLPSLSLGGAHGLIALQLHLERHRISEKINPYAAGA